MGDRPTRRVGLWRAIVAVLIVPSAVAAVAMFMVDPVTGLVVSGLTLGVTMALLWSARRGRLVATGLLFLIAAFGVVMTFAIGLGRADSMRELDPSVRGMDALGPAFLSFLIAMAASIVLAVIQALRTDDDPHAARHRPGRMTPVGISSVPLTIGATVGYTSAYPWDAPGGLEELGRVLVRGPVLAILAVLGIALVVGVAARARGGPRGGRVGRLALGGAGILGLASLGGFILPPVLGVTYAVPFVGFGSATARFDGPLTFDPDPGAFVECKSVAGGAVSSVYAELGWLIRSCSTRSSSSTDQTCSS